jgi:hypothetical protein
MWHPGMPPLPGVLTARNHAFLLTRKSNNSIFPHLSDRVGYHPLESDKNTIKEFENIRKNNEFERR